MSFRFVLSGDASQLLPERIAARFGLTDAIPAKSLCPCMATCHTTSIKLVNVRYLMHINESKR